MRDRSHAALLSRPLLVLSILVAMFAFFVLHDSGYEHAAETATSTHSVAGDTGVQHSLALCALLIVGASATFSLRQVRAKPRRALLSDLSALNHLLVTEPRSSPGDPRSRLDFRPILA